MIRQTSDQLSASRSVRDSDSRSKNRQRRTCFVHIGLNKSGSSTIQYWLRKNMDPLALQGIRYDLLWSGRGKMSHHNGFPAVGVHLDQRLLPNRYSILKLKIDSLEDQAARVAEFEAGVDASTACPDWHTYVISSENFFAWLHNPASVEKMHEWFLKRFDHVTYVIYLRDQLDWVPSGFSQMVKMGGSCSMEEYIAKRGTMNYFKICNRWADIVGGNNLKIRLLERDFLVNGDLIADFAEVIGANSVATHLPKDRNLAMSAQAVSRLRRVNELTSFMRVDRLQRLRSLYAMLFVARAPECKLRLSPQQAVDVARRNAESNEKLRVKFFGRSNILFSKSHKILAEADAIAGPATRT